MKKWVAILLMLVLALSLTGCQQDPEKEAAKVVAEVNGEAITKGEAQVVYNQMMMEMQYYYNMYGYSFDATDKSVIASVKSETLTLMSENLALEQKANELGLGLTEEETASVDEDAQSQYDEMISNLMTQYSMTEEEAINTAEENGSTLAMIRYFLRASAIETKLRDYAGKDETVTDDEIQTEFDSRVASAKESYETTPTQYGTDVLNGTTVYYRPAGYRNIQNLVIALPDDVQSTVQELSSQLYNASYYKYMYDYQLANDTSLDDETKADYTAKSAEYQQQVEDLQAQISAASEEGRAQIQQKAEEILALCKAEGADFDALMAEYNADTATGALITEGYPVCDGITSYVDSFTEGAMALENVGDISDLIASDYGYHILKYASDVQEGPVELDEAHRAEIESGLLTTKQDAAYTAARDEWIGAAKIKTYARKF